MKARSHLNDLLKGHKGNHQETEQATDSSAGRLAAAGWSGGGRKCGSSYGETDEFCYRAAQDPVHVHDLQATILRQLGIEHEKLTFRYQGRDFRLTDVHGAVVNGIVG